MRRLTLLTLGALAATSAVATAQAPSADEIMSRYVQALGGEGAIRAQTARQGTGQISVPAQGITGDLEIYQVAPNKILMRATIPGIGQSVGAYDGEHGWSLNPAMGPMLLEGRMLDQMRQQAEFYSPLTTGKFVVSRETVGQEEFDGKQTYRVKVVTKWDEEYFEFYDVETGLMVGVIRNSATPMGEIESTTVLSDYRDVGGVMIPHKVTQSMMGMQQIFTTELTPVGSVPDSVFAPPPQIQALIEQQ